MRRLETTRLVLRSYEEHDLPEYHKLLSDKENMYYLDFATDTLEESRESLSEAIEINNSGKARRFAVTLDNKLIGGCG